MNLAEDSSWIYHLTDSDITAIDRALTNTSKKALNFPQLKKEDFLVTDLEPTLNKIANELEQGRGFFLLRGLPTERYSEEEIRTIY